MIELDQEMIEGLKSIGFKHDVGEDETGHQMKYFRRGGGYNLDAGSSALMIKGKLGLLQFDRIERFTAGRCVAEGRVDGSGGSHCSGDGLLSANGARPPRFG